MADPGRTDRTACQGELFRLLAENVQDYAIFLVDPEGRVLTWSHGAERLLGYGEDEMLGQPCDLLFTPEDQQFGQPQKELKQARANGRGEDDRWHVRKDGSRFWSSGVTTPLYDQGGTLRGFAKILRDRTEFKRAQEVRTEKALRQSEEYRQTFERSAVGMAQVAPDGRCRRVNERLCAITGYSREELLGLTLQALTYPDDRDADLGFVRRLLAGEVNTSTREKRYVRKDGSVVWVNLTLSLVRQPAGDPDYFIAVIEDIGRRKELEQQVQRYAAELEQRVAERTQALQEANRSLEASNEALRQSEERFRSMVEGVKDYAIFRLDPEGRIVTWNAGAERIKGYTAAEILGAHFSQFYAAEDRERGLPEQGLREAAAKGRYEGEGWRVRKDGSRFVANVVLTPLWDRDGRLRGYTKVTRDITARKELERQLQRHTAELEQRTRALQEANTALEAFGYSVSHDLRTPLRNMQALAQALEEDYADRLDAGGRDFCRRITAAARKMDTLINDLLAYSRLSRGDLPLGRVDLGRVLVEVQAALANAIRESQAQMTIEGPLPPVFGHRTTLVQVVTNLLGNALKFVAPGVRPQVRVRAEDQDKFVRLWVEDNGIGIAPVHQQRIFQVFERLHGEESYPGTGIGLAIVRKGVERMGGRAGVESNVGRGSRFWIDLPPWGG